MLVLALSVSADLVATPNSGSMTFDDLSVTETISFQLENTEATAVLSGFDFTVSGFSGEILLTPRRSPRRRGHSGGTVTDFHRVPLLKQSLFCRSGALSEGDVKINPFSRTFALDRAWEHSSTLPGLLEQGLTP